MEGIGMRYWAEGDRIGSAEVLNVLDGGLVGCFG